MYTSAFIVFFIYIFLYFDLLNVPFIIYVMYYYYLSLT